MMAKKTVTFILAMLLVVSFISSGLAEEKKKAEKAKGVIILNEEKNYVKVVDEENYKTVTIYLDKGTKLEATVGAKTKDLANEKDSRGRVNLPAGTVAYTMKDGKPVAKKISYKSKAKWGIKAKKK